MNAGTLVRLGVDSFGAVADPLDNSGIRHKSVILHHTGNNAARIRLRQATTIMTLNKNGSGVGGILTNNNTSRTPGALANGVITLGANGGVIAATTGTTLTVAENISGGALTIGTTAIIDGAPKQGMVSLTATNNLHRRHHRQCGHPHHGRRLAGLAPLLARSPSILAGP